MSILEKSSGGLSVPKAAIIAGFGLLVMSVCAPAAFFYFIPQTVVSGDINATIQEMRADGSGYLIGLGLLLVTYFMDVLVAWALYWFLRPGQEALSLLVAWMRLVYAALAFSGLLAKASAYELATSTAPAEVDVHTTVYMSLSQSSSHEAVALLFFGVHLVMLSMLIWKATHVPRWLTLPVLLAGAAYLVLYSVRFAAPAMDLGWLLILGIGELIFMVWLLAFGFMKRVP